MVEHRNNVYGGLWRSSAPDLGRPHFGHHTNGNGNFAFRYRNGDPFSEGRQDHERAANLSILLEQDPQQSLLLPAMRPKVGLSLGAFPFCLSFRTMLHALGQQLAEHQLGKPEMIDGTQFIVAHV